MNGNKVVLKKDGALNINGADVDFVTGFVIHGDGDGGASISVQFAVLDFEVEVGVSSFQEGKPLFEKKGKTGGNI